MKKENFVFIIGGINWWDLNVFFYVRINANWDFRKGKSSGIRGIRFFSLQCSVLESPA